MVASLGGALTGIAVLTGWWALAVVGVAASAYALHHLPPGRRVMVGLVAGTVHTAVTSVWLVEFNVVGAMALVMLQALGWGLAGLAVVRTVRWPWPFAPALAISEWARTFWPLGGYPLSQLWITQADGPFAAFAPVLGPFGVTATVVLAGTAGLAALHRHRGAIAALVTVMVAVAGVHLLPIPASVGTVEVAAVQGGDERGVPAVRSDPASLLQRQIDLTRSLATDVDLVVWPESAVAVEGAMSATEHELLEGLASGFDGTILVGLVERFDRVEGAGWFRNAAVAVAATGKEGRYDKQIPVPFGERVPARALVERVVDLSLVPRDMVPGTELPVIRTDLADIGVAISYENLFPRVARQATRKGAQILAVPTLASSYTTDEIPTQQLAAARMRARETGRDLAIVGTTGPSALIRADGAIAVEVPLDSPQIAQASMNLRDTTTMYTRTGDAPSMFGATLAILVAFRRRAVLHFATQRRQDSA